MWRSDRPDKTPDGKPVDFERSDPLIKAMSGFDGYSFDPVALIKAANFFYGLGFADSLTSLLRHSQIAPDTAANPDNIILIARVLYIPVDAGATLPRLELGVPDLGGSHSPDQFSLFPLHLVQDLPLLLTGGFLVGSEGHPPSVYLNWCTRHGRLRPAPLHPGEKPLAAVDKFLASEKWRQLRPDRFHAGMLRLQALRGMPHLFQVTGDEQQALLATPEPTPFWLAQREKEERLNLAWNPSLYAFQPSQGF